MLRTAKRAAVAGFSSTLSFVKRTRPAISDASSSIGGAIIRHGPHHAAHRSSTTGNGERSTTVEDVASVAVTGLTSTGMVPCTARKQVRAPVRQDLFPSELPRPARGDRQDANWRTIGNDAAGVLEMRTARKPW